VHIIAVAITGIMLAAILTLFKLEMASRGSIQAALINDLKC